jgi:hypothetical protein
MRNNSMQKAVLMRIFNEYVEVDNRPEAADYKLATAD